MQVYACYLGKARFICLSTCHILHKQKSYTYFLEKTDVSDVAFSETALPCTDMHQIQVHMPSQLMAVCATPFRSPIGNFVLRYTRILTHA